MTLSLELGRLPAFVAFADHLSFTKAARALHLSQPALHLTVSKLSGELGVALYRRVGQRLELTREGERVAALGREVLASTERAVAELRGEARVEPLCLAAGEATYRHLIGSALAGERPLKLLVRDREGTVLAVRSGEADLGVAPLDRVPRGIHAAPLAEVPLVAAVREDHPLAARRRVAPEDLAGERLIVPPPGRPHRAAVEAVLAAAGVSWEPAVEATGWELMLDFVALGLGVALVNATTPLPAGVVSRAVTGFAPQRFYLLTRHPAPRGSDLEALSRRLHASAERALRAGIRR